MAHLIPHSTRDFHHLISNGTAPKGLDTELTYIELSADVELLVQSNRALTQATTAATAPVLQEVNASEVDLCEFRQAVANLNVALKPQLGPLATFAAWEIASQLLSLPAETVDGLKEWCAMHGVFYRTAFKLIA